MNDKQVVNLNMLMDDNMFSILKQISILKDFKLKYLSECIFENYLLKNYPEIYLIVSGRKAGEYANELKLQENHRSYLPWVNAPSGKSKLRSILIDEPIHRTLKIIAEKREEHVKDFTGHILTEYVQDYLKDIEQDTIPKGEKNDNSVPYTYGKEE